MVPMRTRQWFAIAASLGFGMVSAAEAVTLTEVNRSTWAGNVSLPSYAKMYVYVPAKLAAKPPIVVSNHSCGSSASGQAGNMPKFLAASDKFGFIMIFPDNPGQNCWDVGSKAALTHDGGGDPHAIATMVRYALKKYNGDSSRVYVLGGSSGAMMTQALLGVYPEIFAAGAPRAGVPCGCWAENYASSNQWSGPCANGTVSKTAQQWGDYVRAINPDYKGHRPRVQIYHGEADATISFNNYGEGIKEWTNVLALPATPTSTGKVTTPSYTYNRKSWKNTCGYVVLDAWSAPGQGHSMTYEEDTIMHFFGLHVAGGQDPEQAACGSSSIEQRLPTMTNLSFVRKERELEVQLPGAGRASVRIINTSGQTLSSRSLLATPNSAHATLPLGSLKPGYYIATASFTAPDKQAQHSEFRFVLTE